MREPFALDTNILIYLEGNDISKRSTAETLLSYDPVIPVQVISEFINVIRRLRNVPKHQLTTETADLFRHCLIAPLEQSTLDLAKTLIENTIFKFSIVLLLPLRLRQIVLL